MDPWNHLSVLLSKQSKPKQNVRRRLMPQHSTNFSDGHRIVDVSHIKARPIPDLKLLSPVSERQPSEDKTIFKRSIDKFTDKTTPNSLLLGTTVGWLAGVGVTKVGKIVAFGIGGSIMVLHFACDLGYIEIHWDKVKEAVGQSNRWVDRVVRFVRDNSSFAVGFTGGFFFVFAAV